MSKLESSLLHQKMLLISLSEVFCHCRSAEEEGAAVFTKAKAGASHR